MGYTFTDKFGSFHMEKPENSSYLYFPLTAENGLKSSITPLGGGDSKINQNTFLLQPVSSEELHNLKSARNFWCQFEEGLAWAAAGQSSETESLQDTDLEEEISLDAGLMWHQINRKSRKYQMSSKVLSFIPKDERAYEVMQVTVTNESEKEICFTPVIAIPLYARSADNLRDHRHVTSLLHRVATTKWGVEVTPTLTFDERGHKQNTLTYFVYGADGEGCAPVKMCPLVEDFIGEGGSLARPKQVCGKQKKAESWKQAGEQVAGGEAMGALAFEKITLAAGESASYCVYFGITDAEIDSFAPKASILESDFSKNLLRRLFGCSFLPRHDYGKGGRGWRDLWQDCLALLIMEPDGVRDMLVSNFGGVRMDGSNATIIGTGEGEFIADRNNITRVWMDHGLWPFMTTEFYIKQTGDERILAEEVPYFKDRQISRGEEKDEL